MKFDTVVANPPFSLDKWGVEQAESDKYNRYVATFDEIQENDFNMNIPRYMDTYEEEPEVDVAAVQKEIEKLEQELKVVQAEMKKRA